MIRKEFNKLLPFLMLLIISLLLAGCGGDATNTSTPATTAPASTTTAPASTTVAATTAASAPKTTDATTAATSATTAAASAGSAATAVPSASGGLTMKEAYALAEPQIKSWQPDQFLFSIFNSPDSGIGISPDGRSAEWNFQAISVKVNKRGTWLVKAAKDAKPAVTKTGDEDLMPADAKASTPLPPVSSLIDSSQLMSIAKQNGGDQSDTPVGFFLSQPLKVGDPLAVDLVFYKGNNVVRLRIDMQSGKLVANDKG